MQKGLALTTRIERDAHYGSISPACSMLVDFNLDFYLDFLLILMGIRCADLKETGMIPIPNVKGDTLEKVIEFC